MTRPRAQSERFVRECEAALGARIDAVIDPVLEIAARPVDVDPSAFQALIFTSENAVTVLGASSDLSGLTAYCVGSRTAEAAREHGLKAISAEGNADDLVHMIQKARPRGRILHLRGAHSSGYVAPRLRALGVLVEDSVIYDQVERSLGPAGLRLLREGGPAAIAPLFSPRSAQLLRQAADKISEKLIPVALSGQVAASWGADPRPAKVAAKPTSAAMMSIVLDLYRRDSAC